MARKVIWSDEAIADLADLVRHIAADDPAAAERMGRKIFERTRVLEDFPLTGRMVPEAADPAVREVIVGPYRVIYELIHRWADAGGVARLARGARPAGILRLTPAHPVFTGKIFPTAS
jgi:plasmid stabilization system protein ParE